MILDGATLYREGGDERLRERFEIEESRSRPFAAKFRDNLADTYRNIFNGCDTLSRVKGRKSHNAKHRVA